MGEGWRIHIAKLSVILVQRHQYYWQQFYYDHMLGSIVLGADTESQSAQLFQVKRNYFDEVADTEGIHRMKS